MKNRFSKLGFTLIEILIVITIIGILAVVFLPSILGAPQKARESARQGDITNIVKAVDGGRTESLNLTQHNTNHTKYCMKPNLEGALSGLGAFLEYFPGGVIPHDPTDKDDGTWDLTAGCADGEYLFVVYPKTSDYLYGVFAQVESVENANVKCTQAKAKVPKFADEVGGAFAVNQSCDASANSKKCCYGVRVN